MKIVRKKLQIAGMHCTSCAMNIDFELEDLGGVVSARTSYAKMECEVEFDEEKVKFEKIVATVGSAGYKAVEKN